MSENDLIPPDIQENHQRLTELQKRVTREVVANRFDDGTVESLPHTGQSSGLPLPIAEGWQMEHVYHGDETDVFWCQARSAHTLSGHSHPQTELIRLRDGVMDVTVEGRSHQLLGGEKLHIPPEAEHICHPVQDCTLFLEFSPPIVTLDDPLHKDE